MVDIIESTSEVVTILEIDSEVGFVGFTTELDPRVVMVVVVKNVVVVVRIDVVMVCPVETAAAEICLGVVTGTAVAVDVVV